MNLSSTLGLMGTLQWYDMKHGSQEWQLLLLSCGIVALALIVWAVAIRKKKKRRRRRHRHHHHEHDEAEATGEGEQTGAAEGTTATKSERRRRRRGRRNERRNPTLAETGGLPPVRWGSFNDEDQPPPQR